MTFEEKVKPYYDRYDKAFENNDIEELAYLAQFTKEQDIRKWWRRQICENMYHHELWVKAGYNDIQLNEHGWHEWKIPNYKEQEFIQLGVQINRGCCNTKEAMAIGIMQIANGKWVALVGSDYSQIGDPYVFIGIFDPQYDTRTDAINAAVKKYVESWKQHNKGVKKEDESVRNARKLVVYNVDVCTEIPKMPKGEPIQLSLW